MAFKKKWLSIALIFTLVCSIIIPSSWIVSAADNEIVFGDQLNANYANYSWASVDLTEQEVVHDGTYAIRMEPDYGNAMYLYRDRILDVTPYESFEMWVNGGQLGGQEVKLVFQSGGVPLTEFFLHEMIDGGIPAGEWVKITIPAKDTALGGSFIDTIILWDVSGKDQASLYLDDMAFTGSGGSTSGSGSQSGGSTTGTGTNGGTSGPTKEPGTDVPMEEINGLSLFRDDLGENIQDYGWATHSREEIYTVHTGERSISMEPDNGGAVYLYSGFPLNGKNYESFEMWVHGGETGGQQLKLSFTAGMQPVKEFLLNELITIRANEWVKVEINLAEAELSGAVFDGILITDASNADQATLFLDDLVLRAKEIIPPATIEVRMDNHQLLLLPEERQTLEAMAFYADGTTADITPEAVWASDNPEVVSVNNGELTGLSLGVAKITATLGEHVASAYVQVTEIDPVSVYAEGVSDGFSNWSWHEKDMESTVEAHSGSQSIRFEPTGWDGVWINGSDERKPGEYYGVDFWVHGGAVGGQDLLVHLYEGYGHVGNVALNDYLPDGRLEANTWHNVRINLSDFGIGENAFTGIVIQANGEQLQPDVFIDDVAFLKNRYPGQLPQVELPSVSVEIDTTQNRREISQNIYGINYHDTNPIDSTLPFPVERWGGNNTTRYNWKLDVANRASDWFFMNFPYENEDGVSESDKMINRVTERGGQVLLTVPTIGWTPKDREVRWGYSVEKYGEQRSTAGGSYADAGNGLRPDGTPITDNNPEDTSMRVGPEFVTEWIDHLKQNGDKVNWYALDNEPEIWHVTHQDVHPEAPTYDELWEFTEKYAAAIKEKDPDAKVFGPTTWGWCGYFYSSADNCVDGPDRQAHDGMPFLEWYLKKISDYKAQDENNTQLVDYLDIHYYPQENGIPSDNESAYVSKRRFQSLKTLYDPNFIDQSWIQEPIRLIPRMKEMIEKYNPEMKLAITEYNFGNSNGITSALAQAEALAIFGREGVDLATRFGDLDANTPMEDAFKLYLDYDGQGSQISGTSVSANSSNMDAVGTYAIEGTDGKIFVLLFNKDTVAREANVAANIAPGSDLETYQFTSEQRLQLTDLAYEYSEEGIKLNLPARSATLLVWNK